MLRKRCVFQSYVRRSESREISNYTRVSYQSSGCRNPPRNQRKSPHGAPKHCLHWPLTTAIRESTNKQCLSLTKISTLSISMSICLTFVNKTKEFAHSKHHCKATSSHNLSLTITIITRFCPQICTVPGLITDNLYKNHLAKPHPIIWLKKTSHPCKGETAHKASVRPADGLDRPADWQDVMHMAGRHDRDVWLSDRHLYRAGEQHGSGPQPKVLKPGAGSGGASKPDKRLLCFGRQQ